MVLAYNNFSYNSFILVLLLKKKVAKKEILQQTDIIRDGSFPCLCKAKGI